MRSKETGPDCCSTQEDHKVEGLRRGVKSSLSFKKLDYLKSLIAFRNLNHFIPRLCRTCLINRPVGYIFLLIGQSDLFFVSVPNKGGQKTMPPSIPILRYVNV